MDGFSHPALRPHCSGRSISGSLPPPLQPAAGPTSPLLTCPLVSQPLGWRPRLGMHFIKSELPHCNLQCGGSTKRAPRFLPHFFQKPHCSPGIWSWSQPIRARWPRFSPRTRSPNGPPVKPAWWIKKQHQPSGLPRLGFGSPVPQPPQPPSAGFAPQTRTQARRVHRFSVLTSRRRRGEKK